MRSMHQKGFTIIELVVIMVIIGILAAIAIPQFVNLTTAAETAQTEGVSGAVSSASSINYASCVANNGSGTVVNSCDDLANLVQGVSIAAVADTAAGQAITSGFALQQDEALTNGTGGTCTLHGVNNSVSLTAIGTPASCS